MHRHELAVLERAKQDIDRLTGPVFNTLFIAAAMYLMCWARIEYFSTSEGLGSLDILFSLSASVLVLGVPLLGLALLIELYLRRRISKASRAP